MSASIGLQSSDASMNIMSTLIQGKKEEPTGLVRVIYEDKSTRVEVFEKNGRMYAQKTVKPPVLFGFSLDFIARYMCGREVSVLERLQGIEGVQQLVVQGSPTSFVSEFINGVSLKEAKAIPADFFDKLQGVLRAIYNRGIADRHFRKSMDLLVGRDGNPYVIDLATALAYNPNGGVLSMMAKPVVDYIYRANERFLLRRKARYLPEKITPGEIAEGNNIGMLPWLYRVCKKTLAFF